MLVCQRVYPAKEYLATQVGIYKLNAKKSVSFQNKQIHQIKPYELDKTGWEMVEPKNKMHCLVN